MMQRLLSRHFSSTVRRAVTKGVVSPILPVPSDVVPTPYAYTGNPPQMKGYGCERKDEETLQRMRVAGRIARATMTFVGALAKPGITTDALDKEAHKFILDQNAFPSPWNYCGFPKSICTSVNEVICHGIPDSRPLEDGDVLKIDVSIYKDGVHGDCCHTFLIGNVDEEGKRLTNTAQLALHSAIAACGPGIPFNVIGRTIADVAYPAGYQISKRFCGHGIGHHLHMAPFVLHAPNEGTEVMMPGMTFTIEPILVEGKDEDFIWDDGWTAVSVDGKRGAQFEHTILITDLGSEILTI